MNKCDKERKKEAFLDRVKGGEREERHTGRKKKGGSQAEFRAGAYAVGCSRIEIGRQKIKNL